jgi:hypothetical protein
VYAAIFLNSVRPGSQPLQNQCMAAAKKARKGSIRWPVLIHLRDADGLDDIYEYSFLMTVETRGHLYTSAERTWEDMRMSSSKYYETRASLESKGLITVKRRASPFGTTIIRVNKSAVFALPKRDYENDQKVSKGSKGSKRKSVSRGEGKSATRTVKSATQEHKVTDEGNPLKKSLKRKKRPAK